VLTNLFSFDESGLNSKLGERDYGWGPRGKRVRAKVSGKKSSNFSLLPAFTVYGYIACNVWAINVERFEDFIEEDVLPHCQPFPGPRSVIIMDNASIHRNDV
jgi:DDE superfamily endonuclease